MTSPSRRDRKKRVTFCNQLKELTGEIDESLIRKAYSSCNGDLSSAISYVESYKKEYKKDTTMPDLTGRTLHQRTSVLPPTLADNRDTMTRLNTFAPTFALKPNLPSSLDDPVIDLTEEDADLQQAIKLSMECSAATTPQEIGNATSADLQDASTVSPTTTKSSQPRCNPYLRHRDQGWPAGLKNIGNTCWFNSVMQSLFHLPVFRNLVLQYQPPQELPPVESETYRNIRFMQEMKNLFALLVGTNQCFVDPTKCVTQLLTAFVTDQKHQQQDVSEFTHKLLDWLEDALGHKATIPSSSASPTIEGVEFFSLMDVDDFEGPNCEREEQSNPMVDLFYGEYKAEGINNGNSFTKPQKFGIFPLYVNGIDNLHDSLECTTRDRSSMDHTANEVVGQEHWFTKLPPVLIFELSRFDYNKKSEAPVKIHSRFDFPHLLYMDRYMEDNAERIRNCRGETDGLSLQLCSLKEELKKKRKMVVGDRSYLIQDVLKCCTEFAASKRKRYLQHRRTDCASKRIRNSSGNHSLPEQGAGDRAKDDNTETEKQIEHASVVEECLKNWLDELEREKEALRDDINDIQKRLDTMYDDPVLKRHPYDLHAVLIHQGFAEAGHYWAYVKGHKKWLRYNDTDVRETNWDELIRESIGGGQERTSAYCLMYVDRTKKDFLMAGDKGESLVLADDALRAIVNKHNADYSAEMEEWDLEQAKILSLSAQSNVNSAETERQSRKVSEGSDMDDKRRNEALTSWNAQASMAAIAKAHIVYETLGAEETLEHVLREEFHRLRELERGDSTHSDVRLQHVAVYRFRNGAPRKIIERTLLEQFADDRMTYDQRSTQIMHCAKEKLKTLSPGDLNEEAYQKWHRDYRLFCQATCHLLQGLEFWSKGRYMEALPHLANVKRNNDVLNETAEDRTSTKHLADWDLGLETVQKCLETLNAEALKKVNEDNGDDGVNDGLTLLIDYIVPWIHLLSAKDAGIENPLAKRIRYDWRNLHLTRDDLKEKYGRAVAALMDPPTTFRPPALTKPQNAQDLCERFHKVMSMITQK